MKKRGGKRDEEEIRNRKGNRRGEKTERKEG